MNIFNTEPENLPENLPEPEPEITQPEPELEEQQPEKTKKNTPLYCPHCDWKTHRSAKNKTRGLKEHIRKAHPELKRPKIDILPSKVSEVIDEVEMVSLDTDERRDKLIGDLDILRIKFPNIDFNFNYNPTSSIAHLQRQKKLFLRVLNDSAGTDAVFNLLVISSKALEKIADTTSIADINGYSDDVKLNRDEIYPILKNMVDTGVLDVGHLSPELRLGMLMTSIAISRMETNRVKKNHFLGEGDDVEN